jgi:hypothetical protein
MTATPIFNVAEGHRRKLDVLMLLEAQRETYINRGRWALLAAMLSGDGTASADDVRAAVTIPAGIDPVFLGAVPGELARAYIIAANGFMKSARPQAYARPVQGWKLADRDAALRWLAMHPDLPRPDLGDGGLFTFTNKVPGAGTPGVDRKD